MASVTAAEQTVDQKAISDKLSDWYAINGQLTELKRRESELRQEIFGQAFPDAPEKGTSRLPIGYGKELKAVTKLNYTVDRAGLADAKAIAARSDPTLAHALDLVLRYKPEVIESELLKCTDPNVKRVLAGFITSKPGLPSLEIVDAKK